MIFFLCNLYYNDSRKHPLMTARNGAVAMKQADILQDITLDPAGFLTLGTTQTKTRIWFMGDGIIRIRTSFADCFPEESLSLVWTAWEDHYDQLLGRERCRTAPLVPVMDDGPDQLSIRCDGLRVTVQKNPFSISCGRMDSPVSFRDVPGRAYTYQDGRINHSFCLDDSNFYGFGEKTGPLEKTGAAMRMSNKDACGYDPIRTDPLYKHVPWFIKLSKDGTDACGVYYNTAADCQFDIGREYNGYWPRMGQFEGHSPEVDLFFIAGPGIRDVVKRFCRLTGRPALMPRYAYGYLGSTMFYSELPSGCDDEILSFVDKTHKECIPCSNFHLSSGYTTDSVGRRNVFSWNLDKFPDPAGFIDKMESHGATVTPNIKPVLLPTNPLYKTFQQAGAFICTPSGEPYITQFWGGKGSFVDFSNPDGRALWQKYLKESLLNIGIHTVWNDNNEFDISDEDAICCNEGSSVQARQIRGILPMLMNITSKQALEQQYPEHRLYQVTRSGSAGICRYAQTWTGDNYTCWDSLKYNIATMLGSSLSGIALTGSDIGGFAGPAPDEELFLRWIWCGVLLPRFSIHSANNDNTVTEPWMYPGRMDIVRKAFRLRQKLIPYLYTLGAHAHHSGEPILRPMVYEFPQDLAVRFEDVDFMLGEGLLCACVVEPGATERRVYLPEGETFYDLETRRRYPGGQTITVPAPMDSTPLFQRGGSIIPLQQNGNLVLWVCPDKSCNFTLYEDDGCSNDFKKGIYRTSSFYLVRQGDLVTVMASYDGCYSPSESIQFQIQCVDKAPASILWNDSLLPQILDEDRFIASETGWHYDHSKKCCLVKCLNGRDLEKLVVSFGEFDLIRMDPTK